MAILELRGTLDVSQFWPDGTSDADTVKVQVHRAKFAGHATHGIKPGKVTVRLEGIDAPELHYRPQVRAAKQFRQPLAESATLALRELLRGDELACRVRSGVNRPRDVFDCYGRFVGDLQVRLRGKWVSVNDWLVRHGWAFPAFYDSMTPEAIRRLRRLAAAARRKRLGVWAFYTTDADRFDSELLFRSHGHLRSDRGLVSLPKMFRRASAWWACGSRESLADYLRATSDRWYPTCDFLRGERQHRPLETLLSDHGRVRGAPDEVVFCER